jgi:exodeoxyribonuclease-1
LEDLTAANGLAHEAAHDALSDVTATIAMTKLVKEKQPRLFDYLLQNRGKKQIAAMLNLNERKPFFHISGMLSRAHMYGAIMMPLAKHPTNSNGIICVDLSVDPEALISLNDEQIRRRVFTAGDKLAEGEDRIPLKVIHINKAPVVTTPKLIDKQAAARLNIDLERCEKHWQRLLTVDLSKKVADVFAEQEFPAKPEAEQQLYAGFLPDQDRGLLDDIRRASATDFQQQQYYFADDRYNQLLFSYRARYFPESLTETEQQTWFESCRWRLTSEQSGYLTMEKNNQELAQLLADNSLGEKKRDVLLALQSWSQDIAKQFSL